MLSPKQKAYLKSLAIKEKSNFQIGKEGLNENQINDLINYINKYELLKLNVLRNSDTDFDEIKEVLSEYGMEFVEKKGNTMVFYRHSNKVKDPIVLPTTSKKTKK